MEPVLVDQWIRRDGGRLTDRVNALQQYFDTLVKSLPANIIGHARDQRALVLVMFESDSSPQAIREWLDAKMIYVHEQVSSCFAYLLMRALGRKVNSTRCEPLLIHGGQTYGALDSVEVPWAVNMSHDVFTELQEVIRVDSANRFIDPLHRYKSIKWTLAWIRDNGSAELQYVIAQLLSAMKYSYQRDREYVL